MEFCYNYNGVFNQIKKVLTFVVISMFILLCEYVVVLELDEMNWNIVSRVFYNVFWSTDFGYMK